MCMRSVRSWKLALLVSVKCRREVEAIRIFKTMLEQGDRPDHGIFIGAIRAFGLMDCQIFAREEVHGMAVKMGFDMEASVVTSLMGLYALHGVSKVAQLFSETSDKDVILWSALVSACVKNGCFYQAVEYVGKMQSSGLMPNQVTILSVLPACGSLGALLTGKELHGFVVKYNYYLDTNLQNALMVFYAKCGDLASSVIVFNRMLQKNLASWNIIIRGCLENERPRKSMLFFVELLSLCVKPDETIIHALLSACSELKNVLYGSMLHSYIVKVGYMASRSVVTALLTVYASFGGVKTPQMLFDSLDQKDVIAWSAMISAYSQAELPECAIRVFKVMLMAEEMPNAVTFVSLLKACSRVEVREQGKSIHSLIIRSGYMSSAFTCSTLIDFYCSFGKVVEGRKVFNGIVEKDIVCWGSMINGYGINGYGKDALETFSNMLKQGFRPNDVVFVSVLAACSYCGLIDEGWKWFNCMNKTYGVTPALVHYTCMVDLLNRQGLVEEAVEFIYQMPMKPDASTWMALLNGCKTSNGDFRIMELAAEELTRLEPNNTSYFVILSNLYAEQGEWNDVERVRGWVRRRGLRKTIGYSSIGCK